MEIYDKENDSRSFSKIWFGENIQVIDDLVDLDYKILSPIKGACAEQIWANDVLKKCDFITHFQKLNEKKCPDYVLRYLNNSDLIIAEVKCIASRTIKRLKDGTVKCVVNISHRDPRTVNFPCGGSAPLLNIHRGEYDLLAINIFDLVGEHKWIYCNAKDLQVETKFPKSKCYASLTQEQKDSGYLLKNHQPIHWPLKKPWTEDFENVIKSVIGE